MRLNLNPQPKKHYPSALLAQRSRKRRCTFFTSVSEKFGEVTQNFIIENVLYRSLLTQKKAAPRTSYISSSLITRMTSTEANFPKKLNMCVKTIEELGVKEGG